ncbi:glycerophosphoryl diester phosphodiesterase [Natronoarchaeum philippinense]|uniref:Glycerophosphoryl diester phosphodiesterase n=1 Tax=Natronoarchaeum philippinense TaxID=558529 RepID=A0A285N615_NATPI|nr:glycerophosphodiester phosphodiesterase [Natronoarchaeum philippinense]SNZ03151.1 glycerophosphoryl diester phosphodiesterase [Natronoarchaeum philippinense]
MLGIPNIDRRTVLEGTSAAVLGSYVGGAASAEGHGDSKSSGNDSTALIAHRGFAGVYPENTVAAVENASRGGNGDGAAKRGADMIEIDVVPCGGRPHEGDDFEVVVFHDDRLASRDGGERGLTDHENTLVWETPCSEVRNAEVLESGETVPTLREALSAIPPSVAVNIELKNPGDTDVRFAEKLEGDELEARKDVWRPFTRRVLDIASEFENHVLVSSFLQAALATTREYDADIPIAFLFWDSIDVGLEITDEYDCEALHPPYNMVAGSPFFNDSYYIDDPGFADIDLIERAHDEGRTVNTWTVGTWYQASQLVDAGVDGIIADYPGLLD